MKPYPVSLLICDKTDQKPRHCLSLSLHCKFITHKECLQYAFYVSDANTLWWYYLLSLQTMSGHITFPFTATLLHHWPQVYVALLPSSCLNTKHIYASGKLLTYLRFAINSLALFSVQASHAMSDALLSNSTAVVQVHHSPHFGGSWLYSLDCQPGYIFSSHPVKCTVATQLLISMVTFSDCSLQLCSPCM